jgi:hypothetical protein
MDAGDGRRRKSCPPCRNKGSRGLVRYVSYSRSMLSMCTSASMCCLGLAKVFCIVVGMKGVECCGGSCCLTLKHEGRITPTPLPSPQPPRARNRRAPAASIVDGKATGRCRNTLEALRYGRC